jgi:crossover junction endodeoxyribonuclease RuvC
LEKPHKIVLGIDPGTVIMGYSVIAIVKDKIKVLEIDVLKLPTKEDNYVRLQLIYQKVTELVKLFKPTEFAIEAPFFGKNVQSMLKLGRAQGVAIAAAMHFGLPVAEYSPKRIKQAITGSGNADKDQVFKMLQHLVQLPDQPIYYDATDALGVAICHHFSDGLPVVKRTTRKKSGSSWEKFMENNPDRVG